MFGGVGEGQKSSAGQRRRPEKKHARTPRRGRATPGAPSFFCREDLRGHAHVCLCSHRGGYGGEGPQKTQSREQLFFYYYGPFSERFVIIFAKKKKIKKNFLFFFSIHTHNPHKTPNTNTHIKHHSHISHTINIVRSLLRGAKKGEKKKSVFAFLSFCVLGLLKNVRR